MLELSAPIAAPPVKLATSQTWTSGTEAVMAGWGKVTASGGAVETLRVGEAVGQAPEYCRSKSSHFESTWPTPVPTPAPAPSTPAPSAPTLPVMSRAQAATYATRALQLGLGGRFRGHSRYRASCSAVSSSKQRCSVAWTRGSKNFWGTVTVYFTFEGGKLVWGDRYRVQTLTNCNHPWGFHCTKRVFRS